MSFDELIKRITSELERLQKLGQAIAELKTAPELSPLFAELENIDKEIAAKEDEINLLKAKKAELSKKIDEEAAKIMKAKGVAITLPKVAPRAKTSMAIGEAVRAARGARAEEILNLLAQHPEGLTQKQISEYLGISTQGSWNTLINLLKAGKITRSETPPYIWKLA